LLDIILKKEGIWDKIVTKATMKNWSRGIIKSSIKLYVDLNMGILNLDISEPEYDPIVDRLLEDINSRIC